jgi:hypothetical protein
MQAHRQLHSPNRPLRAAEATEIRGRCCQTVVKRGGSDAVRQAHARLSNPVFAATRPEPSIETSVALTRGGAGLGGTTDEFSAIT